MLFKVYLSLFVGTHFAVMSISRRCRLTNSIIDVCELLGLDFTRKKIIKIV